MDFHPVIFLPQGTATLDLSGGAIDEKSIPEFAIGKYNEKRPGIYTNENLYQGSRNIHMGVDLFAPVGTSVHAFAEGKIFKFTYHAANLDYGYTLITEHRLPGGRQIFALYGHLSENSLIGKQEGKMIKAGDVIAWVGDRHENGGWFPHLHFQLSFSEPQMIDMPGVVSAEDHAAALQKYPDPRLVLGKIYE